MDAHSYKLSPLGPALQLQGGSRLISASSFWILFALLLVALVLDKTLLLLEVDELAEAEVEEAVIVERELAPRLVEVLILKSILRIWMYTVIYGLRREDGFFRLCFARR